MPGQPLLAFNPLKSKTPVETGLSLNDIFFSFEMSRSGKWLALSHGKTEILNWPQKTIAIEAEQPSQLANLGFDHHERHLIIAETTEIFIASVETGRTEYKFEIGSGGRGAAALHPDGEYMVAKHLNNLALVNLRTRQLEKTLECKGNISWELPQTAEMDEMISNLQKIWSAKGKLQPKTPANTIIAEGSLSGRRLSFPATEGMSTFGFDPTGEMLFCATTKGMRVFHWSKLLSAEKEMPKPLFSADSPTDDPNGGYVLDFFFDQARNQIVFAGSFGKISFLSLHSGKTGVLLNPPEDVWIRVMTLSSEGVALCCTCEPNFKERNREVSKFQVWNYPALCKAAGIE